MSTPDLRTAGYTPADPATEQALASLAVADLSTLIDHHTDTTSYLLMYDTTATWYDPKPQVRTVAVHRDPRHRTFALDAASHTGIAFAQRWLADRGAPLDAISVAGSSLARPADAATEQVEDKIRAESGRYDLVQVFHEDLDDTCDAWTLVRDRAAAQVPVRVFLQQGDLDERTYTLREGAFPDTATALAWLASRTGPLPPVPEQPPVQRVSAARARSAHRSDGSGTAQSVPPSGVQPPKRGRSL
ncbi:glycosyl hydrolase [Streptomyces sp. CA-111067]|uniref:glycosyl hydrolase n=1 Tax=Streptomyces sp. CA-111067 TaxID=3240046 RepID=UPI003D97C606